PSPRISAFNRPGAFVVTVEPRELLQTSSASWSVTCAGVSRCGRISYSLTRIPRSAACHAASLPASPPPITISSFLFRISSISDPQGSRLAKIHAQRNQQGTVRFHLHWHSL